MLEGESGRTARPAVEAGGELPEGAAPSDEEPPPPPDDPHRALDLDLELPLREEELLSTRIQQYPSQESGLLIKKSKASKNNKSSEKSSTNKTVKKKKEKKSKYNKDVDLLLSESDKNNVHVDLGNLLIGDMGTTEDKDVSLNNTADVEPDNNHVKSKTEKHKRSKKEVKDKELKKKKSSKKGKHETKVGYEEALGISTPSKEVI
ncbi:hypothetical protein evm_015303 [Chilo suppressalis]|nr:hypothetical protein evm_015303 [Chilo suppressalis]